MYKPNMEIECVGHDDDDWLQHKRRAFRPHSSSVQANFLSSRHVLFPAFSTQFVCASVSALVPVARERDLLSEQEADDLLDEYGIPFNSLFALSQP
jgi:hypothetical protein